MARKDKKDKNKDRIRIKRRKEFELTIKLCPTCKKPTLRKLYSPFAHTQYECTDLDCNYVGAFYIEIDPDAVEQWKNPPNEEESDQNDDKDMSNV